MSQSTDIAADKADRPVIQPPERNAAMFKNAGYATDTALQADNRTGIQKMFPKWVVDNATQITNFGLMTFTSVMLYSGFYGKKISQKGWDWQTSELKKAGYEGARLDAKIEELVAKKTMQKPELHKLRFVYLLTAISSFAIGTIFKRRDETPEEIEHNKQMSLPQYVGMRVGQTFDLKNHSRQAVGFISGLSGAFAIVSALSQPGGIHQSELLVGTSLLTGGSGLALINDPKQAQNWFSTLWMMRIPFIFSGTVESVKLPPKYVHPLVAEHKAAPEYAQMVEKVRQEGFENKPWYVFQTIKVKHHGENAVKEFEKGFDKHAVQEHRNDFSYPIGQWGNLMSAFIGYLGKGKKVAEPTAQPQASDTTPTPEVVVIPNGKPLPPGPLPTIAKPQLVAKMQDESALAPEQARA